MAMPKSVIRINNKNGITFIDNVDRTKYTLRELTRAALRDTGKYVCKSIQKELLFCFQTEEAPRWSCDSILGSKTRK